MDHEVPSKICVAPVVPIARQKCTEPHDTSTTPASVPAAALHAPPVNWYSPPPLAPTPTHSVGEGHESSDKPLETTEVPADQPEPLYVDSLPPTVATQKLLVAHERTVAA